METRPATRIPHINSAGTAHPTPDTNTLYFTGPDGSFDLFAAVISVIEA
jgi:hypothetical protein